MAINKVVYGDQTLIDLTSDTATAEDVVEGKTFHDASGQLRTGTGGGGSGDSVNWTQIQQSGTKIAEIEINGTTQDVYAPTGGGGGGEASYTTLFENQGTTSPATITLSDDITNYDAVLFQLHPTSSDAIFSMLYDVKDLVIGDTIGAGSSTNIFVWYYYTDATTLTFRVSAGNVYMSKIIGIKFGSGGGSGFVEDELATASSFSNISVNFSTGYDAFIFYANDTTVQKSESYFYTRNEITDAINNNSVMSFYPYGSGGFCQYNITRNGLQTLANRGGFYVYKIIGLKFGNGGGSGSGFESEVIYQNAGSTVPSTIALSKGMSNYDAIMLSGYRQQYPTYWASSIYLSDEITNGRVIALTDDTMYAWYTVTDDTTLTSAGANIVIDKVYGLKFGGGGSANIVELTQAEYDALPDSKLSDDVMYLITDKESASEAELTHIHGVFIDPSNVIVPQTAFRTSLSYTATEDCVVCVYLVGAGQSSTRINIDGKYVQNYWQSSMTTTASAPIFIKKGQTLTVSGVVGEYDSSYIVYGVQLGSNVTFLSEYASACYSTTEREVGCWVDGKPLYQKTFTQQLSGVTGSIDISALNAETAFIVDGFYDLGVTNIGLNEWLSNGNYAYTHVNNELSPPYIDCYCTWANSTITVTIQYTKTTDTAGSGTWTPTGTPTVHYSTDEQVIGTWIDGKSLYEKTVVYIPSGTISSNTTIANIPNAKVMRVTEATAYNPSDNRGYVLPDVRANGGTKITYNNGDVVLEIINDSWSSSWTFYVTIQYTKTTD